MSKINKLQNLNRRKQKIRKKIIGSNETPRLNVFRSNKYIYIQAIDDSAGKTLFSVHSKVINSKTNNVQACFEFGKEIAKKAMEKNINQIKFDRGGRKYHGKIKAIADGAREGGLNF